jgi:hypothetical protein
MDHEIQLKPAPDGTQAINLSKLASGPWLMRVKWQADGQAFYLEQKIIL